MAERPAQYRTKSISQPAQPIQYFCVVAAEPHDLTEALVDGAIGLISISPVLDHQHRLVERRHPGHRADGIEMMVGMKVKRAVPGHAFSLRQIRRPTLEDRNPRDGAAHGATHTLPADGRACM